MRKLLVVVAGLVLSAAVTTGCVPDQPVRVPAPSSTAPPSSATTTKTAAQQGLPSCAELGALPGLPAGATLTSTAPEDNPLKCEWRGGDTTVQIGLWEYEKAPTANASFTNLLMLCPGEEIEPVGIAERSAYCGRKVAPACNLIANQGVFHIDVIWTAPAGTDEQSCRNRASALGGEVSRLLG